MRQRMPKGTRKSECRTKRNALFVWVLLAADGALAFAPSPFSRYATTPPRHVSQPRNRDAPSSMISAKYSRSSQLQMIPIEASSLLTSVVEYFDGSEVIDPVVISNSFSAGMQSRFVSFIIGQLLAAATFAAIASVASQQISRAGEWVTDNFLKNGSSSQQQQPLQNNSPPNGGSNFVAIRKPDFTKLLICVAIDIIGTSSELIPILGEVTDVVWAPIAALLLRSLYGGSNVLLVLEFAEEILPVTDILPLATICWVVDTFFPASDLAKLLQLGVYRLDYLETPPQPSRPNEARGKPDVIDVEYRETKQKQLRSAAVDETNTSSKPS